MASRVVHRGRGKKIKRGRCAKPRRASFAQLLCAAEDKQQRRRLARSSLKSWKKKKESCLIRCEPGWRKKRETTGESNPRPFPSCFPRPFPPSFASLPPEERVENPAAWLALAKITEHARKNARRGEEEQDAHTRPFPFYFLSLPRFLFRSLIADACERIRRRRRIFFREPGIPFHGGGG